MTSDADKPSLAATGWRARRVSVSDRAFPHVIEGTGWVGTQLRAAVVECGAVLIRGTTIGSEAAQLAALLETVAGPPVAYHERSSPRRDVGAGLYTSTDYPADQSIALHNESSYAAVFPSVLAFGCVEPATEDGATPIADCRRVLERLSRSVRGRFERDGVRYIRRHGGGLGLDWRVVAGTEDRSEAEQRLVEAGYELEWMGDRLETRRVGPAIVVHPESGGRAWFNHAAFFHVSTLPATIAASLIAELGEGGLPAQTYHGDGDPIALDTLVEIRDAYRAESVDIRWQRGDVLLVDNLSVAHGRKPYRGDRRIIVGMAGPCRSSGSGGVRAVEAIR